MSDTTRTLIELVHEALQEPAGRALEELLERLRQTLTPYLVRRFGRHPPFDDAVADILQETSFRIAHNLSAFRGSSDPEVRAWALTTARHVAIDYLRWQGPRYLLIPLASISDDSEQEHDDEQGLATPNDAGPPSPTRARQALRQLTMECYQHLSPSSQELLWWRIVRQASWTEVGQQFGISGGAAKRRWQRAEQRIRRQVTARIAHLPSLWRTQLSQILANRDV